MLNYLLALHHKSQTIIWARIQQIVGVTGAVIIALLQMTDGLDAAMIAPWLPEKAVPMLPLIFFILGRITEQLRKRPGSTDPIQ